MLLTNAREYKVGLNGQHHAQSAVGLKLRINNISQTEIQTQSHHKL